MKIVTKSEDDKTYFLKISKKEHDVINYVINHDDNFNKKFEVITNTLECIIIQKGDVLVDDCIGFLKHCFANDVISQVIREEKIKKLKNDF